MIAYALRVKNKNLILSGESDGTSADAALDIGAEPVSLDTFAVRLKQAQRDVHHQILAAKKSAQAPAPVV